MSEPVNCFLLFCKEERKTVSQHCRGWDNSQVTSHLGELWRQMDSRLKLKYKNRAETAKQNFVARNPNFKRKTKVESRYVSSFRLSGRKKISKPVQPQRPLQYFDIPPNFHNPPSIHHPRGNNRPVQTRSASFPFETLHYYSHYCNPFSICPCDCFTNQMYK
mmetsp:Transcript_11578/g.14373  ORF Transcript_11578/g.14373 Transcript_11578/m.14373 type:complete len:162 (+) Transcript_11578:157-642(+)